MIIVAMTATRRPEVIRRTLRSFKKNLFKDEKCRLIINVDPVGDPIPSARVVDVCREFFDAVTFRCPKEASFPVAFRWCWQQANGGFVFHLEDDWELLREVNLKEMLGLMERIPELAVLRLPYSCCSAESNKSWNKFVPWNGEFFEVPEENRGLLGFSGHPSLIRSSFVNVALKILNGKSNPEKALKWRSTSGYGKVLQGWRYGVFAKPGDGPVVVDIGRGWKEAHGWKKAGGSRAVFTRWEVIHANK